MEYSLLKMVWQQPNKNELVTLFTKDINLYLYISYTTRNKIFGNIFWNVHIKKKKM